MSRATARGGRRAARRGRPPDTAEIDLAREVREVAEHLQHAAQLALIASTGEEPERGACHVVSTIRDLRERLALLEAACCPRSSRC